MKELSIEEKAKAYDEAIERAKEINNEHKAQPFNVMLKVFPELKESEDEKIRKELINFLENVGVEELKKIPRDICEWFAWLERIGRHEPMTEDFENELAEICNQLLSEVDAEWMNNEIVECIGTSQWLKLCNNTAKQYKDGLLQLVKQGEQKHADKVEPKFHKGDWCIDNEDGTIFQIVKVLDNTYTYKTNDGKEYSCTHYSLENDAKPWTIQDAKDGDVLAYRGEQWIFIYKERKDETHIEYYALASERGLTINDVAFTVLLSCVVPSTKEQRDLLFQKMKETGYEWDAEKKELKKVESTNIPENFEKYVEHLLSLSDGEGHGSPAKVKEVSAELLKLAKLELKSSWSEEDKKMSRFIGNAITADGASEYLGSKGIQVIDAHIWLEELKDRVQPKQEWSKEDNTRLTNIIIMLKEGASHHFVKDDITKAVDWLKSIRTRTWEPSEKQINALSDVLSLRDIKYDVLSELLECLKKLI